MRSICFYFQVHQPLRLRNYRFFDIGKDHYYWDDYQNKYIARRIADKCYLPTNKLMLDIISEYGTAFKIAYSISGVALDTFEKFTPDVINSFQELANTGCVEFLAETDVHSLCSLKSKQEFIDQVSVQSAKIEKFFGKKPVTYRNTELIYSDEIGEMVAEMGFQTMLTEGAKHILGWKSPNYMYVNARNPKLKLLLKNFQLSDDIAFRFSNHSWPEWPLTADKFVNWLNDTDPNDQMVNLFMDYETFGEHQWHETGIFEFMKILPKKVFENSDFKFNTPNEITDLYQPVASIHVPYPISWADEERDLTAWLGNELQDEAFEKIYELENDVKSCKKQELLNDWRYLQTSDHFYYMCTKWFSDGDVHKYFNPYGSPYEAFINYMNVLSDFEIRVKDALELGNNNNESNRFDEVEVSKSENIHKIETIKEPEIAIINKIPQKEIKKIFNKIDAENLYCFFKGIENYWVLEIKAILNGRLLKKVELLEKGNKNVTAKNIEKRTAAIIKELKTKLN